MEKKKRNCHLKEAETISVLREMRPIIIPDVTAIVNVVWNCFAVNSARKRKN